MRGLILTVAAAAVIGAAPAPAGARDVHVGPRFNVSDDADLGVGADVRWTFLADDPRLALTASFDYFFPEDGDQPFGDAFATKWVELFRDVVPGASRVGLLWNPEIPAARRRHTQMQRAAQAMKLELISLEVRRAEDFEPAFEIFRHRAVAGLIVAKSFLAFGATKFPPMKTPYRSSSRTWSRDSGAGE